MEFVFCWMGLFSSVEHLLYPVTHFSHALGDYFVSYGIISLLVATKHQKNAKFWQIAPKKKNGVESKKGDMEKVANDLMW